MNKSKRILLIAVFALLICALGLVLFLAHEPPEPNYQGRPLTYWLAGYDSYNFKLDHPKGPPPPTWKEADDAIPQMGTNCLPRLLRMLQRHDSPWRTKVRKLVQRQHLFDFAFLDPGQDFAAFQGIQKLGAAASNAVPELIRIYDAESSSFGKQAVPAIIAYIGPAAQPAVSMLLRAAAHTNEIVRHNAVYALGRIHMDAEKVVPVLVNCLNDPQRFVQAEAIKSLAAFGTNARSAFPALAEFLGRENTNTSGVPDPKSYAEGGTFVFSSWSNPLPPGFRLPRSRMIEITQEALKSIDPEAAAKAGIK